MLDPQLRQVKEQMLVPVARQFSTAIHPTTLSLIGGAVGLAAGLAAWQNAYWLALLLWLLNRLIDGLDGTVARLHNKQSDLGGYLDTLIDHVIYAFIPAMVVLGQPDEPGFIALVFLLGTFYVNAASWMFLAGILEQRRQGAKVRGDLTTLTMPTGLIEGTETVVFYTLLFLLPGWIVPLFLLMGALLVVTIVQRLVWAARYLSSN